MTRSLIAILCVGMLPLAAASAEPAATFNQGVQAEQELRIYEARDLFRQALEANPDAPGAAEHTAWFLFLNGFHDEECRDLLRRAAPQAQEPAAMERAARFIERRLGLLGPADDAEQEAQAAFHRMMIERATGGTDEQLGGALVDAGDFEKGIPLLEKALAADPMNGPLSLRLARAYVWSQRLPEADAAYEKLLERYPDNPAVLMESGQVAAGRGMLERARSSLPPTRHGPMTRGSCASERAWRRRSRNSQQPQRRRPLRRCRRNLGRSRRRNSRPPRSHRRQIPPLHVVRRLKNNCGSTRPAISFGRR